MAIALLIFAESALAINVNTCQIINSPGKYNLTANLIGAPIPYSGGVFGITQVCLKIASSNVDLHCNGFSITNNGTITSAGVMINASAAVNYTNVTIHDCPSISKYTIGIAIDQSSGDTVDNVTAHSNLNSGIFMYRSSNNNITNNIIYNHTSNGIILFQLSYYNQLINNTVYNTTGGHGFQLSSNCQYNALRNNEAYNTQDGFRTITGGHNNTFINNTAHDNSQQGFDFLGGTNGLVMINNTAYNNQQRGVYFSNVHSSRIEGNTVYNSSQRGFDVLNSDNNQFSDNILYGNGNSGSTHYDITLSSTSNGNTFRNTTIYTDWPGYAGSRYLKQFATANPTNEFYNFKVCLRKILGQDGGCADWGYLNLSNATLNMTFLTTNKYFVSLNSTSAPAFNAPANITLLSNYSCRNTFYYKLGGFPQSWTAIITNGTRFTPSSINCIGAGPSLTTFEVSSFSGYATNASKCYDNDGDGFGSEYGNVTGNTNDGSSWRFTVPVTSPNAIAENFSVAKNTTILQIGLRARRGTPLHQATLDVHIRTNLSDPTTKIASVSIPATSITPNTGGNWVYADVTFNLTAGTTYYFVVGSNLTGLNAHRWEFNQSGDPYPGGALWVNGAPEGKGDSDGTFMLYEEAFPYSCPQPNYPDCDDRNASILPPYYGMIINNDTYLCSGVYNVTGAITGITFNNSNIKLVCQDTTINNNNTANSLHAIGANAFSGITITGCTIQNYNRSYGIFIMNLRDANITNNTFIHNGEGIDARNTTNVWIYNNSFYNHSDPYPQGFGMIAQQGVYNWTVQNNYFENSASADLVLYDTGSGNLVENNTCNSPGPGGVVSMGMNGTTIRNNVAYGHTGGVNLSTYGYGIIAGTVDQQPPIVPEYSTWIYNNTVYNNDVGIALLGNNSLAENNTIHSNTFGLLLQNQSFLIAGFVSPGGHNNTIRNNNVYNNTNGIYMDGSDLNTIDKNTLTDNTQHGIYAMNSFNTTITNNEIDGSNHAIYFPEDNRTQSCNGFVLACGSFINPITCNNQIGCFWNVILGVCGGFATPCNLLTKTQCAQQQSCSMYTNYYNDQYANITNNNISNGITGMNLSGRWGKALLFTTVIKGGYHNIFNNRILNFNTGLFMKSNFNNIAKNIFNGNTKDIISQGGQLVINNQIKNTTLNTVRTGFNYTGDFDITHGRMVGRAPAGKASIGKFLDITNNTNLVPSPFVNLTIHYSAADIINIKDESTLRLYRYNNNQWAAVPGSTVNTTANYVKADLTSFSMFGVFGTGKLGPAGGGGGGGAGISSYYKQVDQTTTEEQTTEWPTANTNDDETQEEQGQEKQKATVKAPEIKTEKQKEKTQLKILQYIPSTKAIIPGIFAVAALVSIVAYLVVAKTPPAKPKIPRLKEIIDLEGLGFKVKK